MIFVDYNKIADKFSASRKNMKWEEISYFFNFIENLKNKSILDIWCGSGRLLEQLSEKFNINDFTYLWLDLSDKMIENAKKNYPDKDFLNLNMLDIDKIDKKFDYIFFIASFHHLDNLEDREDVLKKAKSLLKIGGKIFMTNWALDSEVNKEKYWKYIISWSKNEFWSLDYKIPFWDYERYYHGFNLDELKFLFEKTWFEIIENRLFDNKKNFISILQKNWD